MISNDSNMLLSGLHGQEHGVAHPKGGDMWLRPALLEEIEGLRVLIATEITADVGSAETMRAVFQKNRLAFWCIERREPAEGKISRIGMYGFLPLNEKGAAALRSEALDRRSPDIDFITPDGTKPAALYVWALVARGVARLTYPLIKKAFGPAYADVPVFAIPATRGGTKAVGDRGFVPVGSSENSENQLALLTTPEVRPAKASPEYRFEVIVASTAEHLQMSAYIRGATFGAEQRCPYHEEFDGNDFCAMHLIGFVDGEPAANLRIRFFASFAKLERLAVVERFRKTVVKNLVMERAIEICRRKGYATLYGQSQERLLGFYSRFGFQRTHKNRKLVFSDHNYIEIARKLDFNEDRITIDSDPYTIIRPEGYWDSAGVLERSAERPASNPI